jgi:hypothetical protein
MNQRLLFPLLALVFSGLLIAGCGASQPPLPQSTVTPSVTFATFTPDFSATEAVSWQATLSTNQTQNAAYQATLQANRTQSAIAQATNSPHLTQTSQALHPTRTPTPTTTPFQSMFIEQELENVLVPLVISPQQLARLSASGVVASPREYAEFHDLYLETTYANLPVFVTSDAMLHIYHLTFDEMLSSLEEHVLLARLQELNQILLMQIEAQYQQLIGTVWEDAAHRIFAYIAVGSKLANPDFVFPDAVKDLAQAEVILVNKATGTSASPIFPLLKYGEDYSQYSPRGHYTKSLQLRNYFKTMMWYGRMTFRLNDIENPEVGPTETRMALLLSLAVRDGTDGSLTALKLWEDLYSPTAFLVGRSDDLTVQHYLDVMDDIYGTQASLTTIADDTRMNTFISAADKLPAPRILSLISDDYKPLESVKGLRLMGQQFVPDAYIFQELIHPNVRNRYLPSGLDVMSVMGSDRAVVWLAQDPTTQNPDYTSQSNQLIGWLADLTQIEWTETAYNSWLYTLRSLLFPPLANYPLFMQSTAWQDKQLNTALGSWAELKHDTLLYAKQAYGGLGGCGFPVPPSPALALNYVEPVPTVFSRIAALIHQTRTNLEQRGLLQLIPKDNEFSPGLGDRLASLESISLAFKSMAEKELQGLPLTEAEQATLRSFGEYMEEVVIWANGDKPELDPAAIIADVATDPNTRQVLEVGTGYVHEIYVVAPIPQPNGFQVLTVARGGIYSYYEFPSQERLNDETWRLMLENDPAPTQPAFSTNFSVPEPASLDIQAVIYRFQRDWAGWMYYTSGYVGSDVDCPKRPGFTVTVSDQVRQQFETAIAELPAQNQYEARRWLNTDYLSVAPVTDSPDRLLVTARETWSDYLVTYQGSDPFAWYKQGNPEPVSAHRGPYTIDVAYLLEHQPSSCDPTSYSCYQWSVVSVSELTQRPAWVNR